MKKENTNKYTQLVVIRLNSGYTQKSFESKKQIPTVSEWNDFTKQFVGSTWIITNIITLKK